MRIVGVGGVRRLLRSWLLAAGLAGVALACTSPAQAAPAVPAYAEAGNFGGPGSADGEFTLARRVAVEPTTGNILVTDSGNARIEVFSPDPAATGTFLTSISTALGTPYGIAIDQSTGDVYVSESGTNQIVRYQSDGATPTPTYTLDASFVSPVQGTGTGQVGSFASPIAVDPTTHDVLVADTGNKRVSRFTSSGLFVAPSFNGADTAGGAFTGLLDLAVGPTGTIYVIDSLGPLHTNVGTSRLEQFSSAGVAERNLGPVDTPRSVTIDPVTGSVLVGGRSKVTPPNTPLLSVFSGSGAAPVSEVSYPTQFLRSQAVGLAVSAVPTHRVYGLVDKTNVVQGTTGVQAFDPSAIPGVSVDAPNPITATTAHLRGRVDPGGQATDAHFEYALVGSSLGPAVTPDQPLSGSGEQPVSADITGLDPFSDYEVRLVASNGAYNASDVRTFMTGQAAPDAVTEGATEIDAGGAVLNGRINPYGLQTTYVFEYGETADYGRKVPAAAAGIGGNGHVSRALARAVRGLRPGTTYHYRLVARNGAGSSAGSDATFTTAASNLAARAYEQVSPADKAGATIDSLIGFQAKPDGNGLVYKTANPDVGVESAPRYGRYASLRSSEGWMSRTLDAPSANQGEVLSWSVMAVSEDLSHAFVVSTRRLTDGGVDGNTNLYVRDLRSGGYALVATIAGPAAYNYFLNVGGEGRFVGGAKDFSWIVFSSQVPLTPGATGGADADQLYRWSAGKLSLVSVLPDGSPSQGWATARTTPNLPEVRATSDDGRAILFTLTGAGPDDGVYLRKDGATTVPLSVSQIGGAPSTPEPAYSLGISRDGRYATFYVASATPLTTDAPAASGNLYRYDGQTGQLEYLLAGVGDVPVGVNPRYRLGFKVSDDGSHVYFPGVLGSSPPGTQLAGDIYVWHDGVVKHVANIPYLGGGLRLSQYVASPNGRYFAFGTYERLTSYDNTNSASVCKGSPEGLWPGQCHEVYVYDADTEKLTCASCPPDGRPSLGDARLPNEEISLSNRYPRALTDQGQVFFDTASALVSGDVNGTADVYAYQDEKASLISPGTAPVDARFADASDDGSNVFFVTAQSLVGQDQDGGAYDVYDARLGGGIAAQNPSLKAPCAGSECAEPTSGPVGSSEAPSQLVTGKAGVAKPTPKPRISVVKSSFTRSAIRVTVRVTGRGRMRASGSRVVTTVRNASDVGSYTLTVPLNKKTRAAIRRRHRVKVSVKVSFTPPFRAAVSTKLSRTLGK